MRAIVVAAALFVFSCAGCGGTGTQGPQGPAGPTGPQGPAGVAGPEGPAGPQGVAGLPGNVGAVGPAGPGVALFHSARNMGTALTLAVPKLHPGAKTLVTTTKANQQVLVSAYSGCASIPGSAQITYSICHGLADGGVYELTSLDMYTFTPPADNRLGSFSRTELVTIPDAGTWDVGLCVSLTNGVGITSASASAGGISAVVFE